MSTVEITEREGGGYSVVETGTGAFGEGETLADALETLAESLRQLEDTEAVDDPESTYDEIVARVRERFDAEGISEADVEDAVEWARSE